MSGSLIVVSFQAFMAETSAAGFNYSDVFFTYSQDGGSTWSYAENLSRSDSLDERYPSMSKWNAERQANMVWQEDPVPGSHITDFAPVSFSRQVFCRISDLIVDVEDDKNGMPGQFTLSQNYPNPFNSTTVMSYELRVKSGVRLVVCDLLGQEVATLVNEEKPPGSYSVVWDATGLAAGVYFCRLEVRTGHTRLFTSTRKMAYVR
jgi:hypothetical protein